ncbi:MAG: NAD(P)H-binding protein [Ferruginibacter sp.]
MKIIVFGASGGTGQLAVQQALSKGHEVTAFVRNPAKLSASGKGLKIVKGDVLQQHTIDAVINGHDAVLCCLGAPATKVGRLRSKGTKNIIAFMNEHGITRLICQTSLGFDDSEAY